MKRPEELSHMLTEMYNDTKDGKIHWNISVQTTENNEVSEKPVEVEDGVSWTIDECYVSYYCKYKGRNIPIRGIILNNWKGGVMEEDNVKMIEEITGVSVIAKVAKGDEILHCDPKVLEGLYQEV